MDFLVTVIITLLRYCSTLYMKKAQWFYLAFCLDVPVKVVLNGLQLAGLTKLAAAFGFSGHS